MHRLAAGIYAETSFKGVNVGAIVTPDGIVCIDTPTNPADCRKWRLKLAQLGGQPIRYVINTDHHRDRVLGNQWFEAPVIAHQVVGERLRAYPDPYRSEAGPPASEIALAAELNGVQIVPPQLTFDEHLILVKGGREIHLLHRPGSAPGAIWVHLPERKILFTGDAVVLGMPPLLGEADLDAWIENLSQVRRARFPADVIVPGRGPLSDKDGVKEMIDFLRTARRKINRLASRRGPADAASILPDLLDYFPVAPAERDLVARRFKSGIDRLIEEARGEAAL